ncbi:hypothetical protein QBC40DRAFT_282441 [Triangularia verruculosa]|uniref:Uncharacterized protein n=1 Tax=Triangularia verruculosa TaxID=2587418 RepID=A0AAN6XEG7_9PEZI|nr:hypothetical protein QBC40DRAFT_282441 [Triangularia verruculosa]
MPETESAESAAEQVKCDSDTDNIDDRRSYVGPYSHKEEFPLEYGDLVWIMQSGRPPLGEFRIVTVHPNDLFGLEWTSTGAVYPDLVQGKYLRRDPFS